MKPPQTILFVEPAGDRCETARPTDALLKRIRAEFLEMPGLRLTLVQAQRLCGVERALCQGVLDKLVAMNFLCRKRDGAYARVTDGADHPRPRSTKAGLATERRFPRVG